MKIIAVQTGLEQDSVLGGSITDRGFLMHLADRGVEVHVLSQEGYSICEYPGFEPHFFRRRATRKIPYGGNIGVAFELRRLIKRLGGVDWIRFNSPYSIGIGTALASNGVRLWGSYLHCEDYPLWKAVDRFLPRYCDLITCLSEDTRRDVVERCPASDHANNVVIPVGLDLERFARGNGRRDAIRQELGVSASDVLFLFVGVLIPRKGVRDLVAAWRLLGPMPGVRLAIVGQSVAPEETALVRGLAEEDPRVRYLPRIEYESIPDYFHASDVFFFPTHREGFGIVVAEAMAAGLPVVTTRAPGVRTVVREDETALVADVGDTQGLAEKLRLLAGDAKLRARLGAAGRARVEKEFAWDPIMDRLLEKLSA
jgi:glycosyltransferase involved in cell wall biosynthesis